MRISAAVQATADLELLAGSVLKAASNQLKIVRHEHESVYFRFS